MPDVHKAPGYDPYSDFEPVAQLALFEFCIFGGQRDRHQDDGRHTRVGEMPIQTRRLMPSRAPARSRTSLASATQEHSVSTCGGCPIAAAPPPSTTSSVR